ncbi:MAG: ABC transporter permease, partial [Candidatus Delongbacteria bacterium]|nr:ABC transporter permease [Candidatus Delongbacteria bacterium]
MLSLSGITIGIFAMISVFTVVDSLERQIRESVSELGENVIYIQKWPWEFSQDYAWWKYLKRPVPNMDEYKAIKERTRYIKSCTFMASTSQTISRKNISMSNTGVLVATYDYKDNRAFDIKKGRYFTASEAQQGRNLAVIGYSVAKDLFPYSNPVGREIKIAGNRVNVIGVFEKEGENMMVSTSHDNLVLLMANYGKRLFDIDSESLNPMILVTASDDADIEQVNDELEIIMRSERRLSPMEEPDFALNRASMISQGIDKIFATLDIAAIIIGGFAILVGGFGIANIMFVSVKERTRIIGIQKAIGAKSGFILTQFLCEAVVLSLIGGVFGLILIWIGPILGTQII